MNYLDILPFLAHNYICYFLTEVNKVKKIAALFLLFIILLCGCKEQDINLENTVWKYGNNVIIYFYENKRCPAASSDDRITERKHT